MASCGFHSPQFSEEIAFLPPWLQPNQLPNLCNKPSEKINFEENFCLEKKDGKFSSSISGYNSCHLYLSGESNTCNGTIYSSSRNALHLSLHLSSSAQNTKHDNFNVNFQKSPCIIENSKLETNKPSNTTNPFLESQETIIKKINIQKDDFTLSQTDIEEAIELSIAASEAMVISKLALNEFNNLSFHSSGAIQAAIRVKQARNELEKEGFNHFMYNSDREIDYSDLFMDLDEFEMADAFNDVGLCDNLSNIGSYNEIDANTDSTLVPCSLKENGNLNTPLNLREENMDINQNLEPSINDFAELEKEQEVRNTHTRKKIKGLFIQETSFISESINTIKNTPLEPTIEPQNEIIASSNSPFNEGVFLSIDPLCSLVPCSIEENNSVEDQENDILIPQNAPDVSCLVKRKRVNSLKIYSVGKENVTFNEGLICNKEKLCLDDLNFVLNEGFEGGNLEFESEKGVKMKKKKVKFLEVEFGDKEVKKDEKNKHKKGPSSSKSRSKSQTKNILQFNPQKRKRKFGSLSGSNSMDKKERIFQGLEFLLTGFSRKKLKEIESIIRGSGGYVLSKLPKCPCDLREKLSESSHWRPPVVICPKKLATTKFLYGCAVNSWVLNQYWLFDSLQASSLISPFKYLIRQAETYNLSYFIGDPFCFKKRTLIFDGIGFLMYGKVSFSSRFSIITKHGGGKVFQSLQELVESLENGNIKTGIIIVENEARSSRHLKYCALEHNIQTLPMSWIIETLFCGKLVPFKKDCFAPFRRIKMPKIAPQNLAFDMSQEI
ncbi:hypothetical protein LUZ60_011305 [Juncus effusus]|nr:hypothetical protein LUZ60_011305 [Juncus effusus]